MWKTFLIIFLVIALAFAALVGILYAVECYRDTQRQKRREALHRKNERARRRMAETQSDEDDYL